MNRPEITFFSSGDRFNTFICWFPDGQRSSANNTDPRRTNIRILSKPASSPLCWGIFFCPSSSNASKIVWYSQFHPRNQKNLSSHTFFDVVEPLTCRAPLPIRVAINIHDVFAELQKVLPPSLLGVSEGPILITCITVVVCQTYDEYFSQRN